MKSDLRFSVYATGRRLHQLATINLWHPEYVLVGIASPDAEEELAARQRYLVEDDPLFASQPTYLATSLVDDQVLLMASRLGATVMLIPPVSILSHSGIARLLDGSGVEVVCVPPVPRPVRGGYTSVAESVSTTTLLAMSHPGVSQESALRERAAWAVAGALWGRMLGDFLAIEMKHGPDLSLSIDVRSSNLYMRFAAVSSDPEALVFSPLDGDAVQVKGYTMDSPAFLLHAFEQPLSSPRECREFAHVYVQTLHRMHEDSQ